MIYNSVDTDGNGEIDFDEFLEMMSRNLGTVSNQDEELRQAFKVRKKEFACFFVLFFFSIINFCILKGFRQGW